MFIKRIILLILIVVTLIGCAGETYSFDGESENWEMELTVYTTGNNENASISINYIGDGDPPEEIDYKINKRNTEYAGHVLYPEKGIEWEDIICKECYPIKKEEKVEVEISWDGNTENFTLSHNE